MNRRGIVTNPEQRRRQERSQQTQRITRRAAGPCQQDAQRRWGLGEIAQRFRQISDARRRGGDEDIRRFLGVLAVCLALLPRRKHSFQRLLLASGHDLELPRQWRTDAPLPEVLQGQIIAPRQRVEALSIDRSDQRHPVMIDRVLQDCVIVAELEKNRCGTVQHWAPCLGKTALDNCFLSSRGALSDSAAAGFCLPGNHVPAGCHGAACRQRLCTNPRPACSPSSPSSLQIAVRRAYALHPRSGSGYRRALVQAPPPLQCRHWAENGLPGFCREALRKEA